MNKDICVLSTICQFDIDAFYPQFQKVQFPIHTHIEILKNDILLKIYYNPSTYLNYKFMQWANHISENEFGNHFHITEIKHDENITSISFDQANIINVQTNTDFHDSNGYYFIVNLDRIEVISKPETDTSNYNTCIVNLTDSGFQAAQFFYSTLFMYEDKLQAERMNGFDHYYSINKASFRIELSFDSSDSRTAREATIKKSPRIFIKDITDRNNTLTSIESILFTISLYYSTYISYRSIRLSLSDQYVFIKKREHDALNKPNSYFSGICKLDFDLYLKSSPQNIIIQNIDYFKLIIKQYIQSFTVDTYSCFLLQFNILELLNNHKNNPFNIISSIDKSTFDSIAESSLQSFLSVLDKKHHHAFKAKWNVLINQLKYENKVESIKVFLKENAISTADYGIDLGELVRNRNNIIHGSIKKINYIQLNKHTYFLHKINGSILANILIKNN